ncbi:chitin synthase export chaperone [Pyrrhoderma noxium]|uniref:Chitin synthase export chaperone n=1 Tax=Pyrrhoderma noxium TaxID=2282107 RepID=A0A286UX27_9AGAM|nr:chitin synthase export chaperone [Pyrrhoderma noxium]
MTRFGDFAPLCHHVPSYPWCNLFYRQFLDTGDNSTLSGLSSDRSSAPIGINPECGIPLVGHTNSLTTSSSLGNIADIIRKAAVGRSEFRVFLILYLLSLPLQLLSTGSVLEQGSTALVALTALHAGVVATLFWNLLVNALVATQVVEDGTMSSLIPMYIFMVLFFVATTYISFDVALGVTSAFGPSNPQSAVHSTPLFVLTSIWPGASALIYFGVMAYIVLGVLRERRPMFFYFLAAVCFVLAQLAWFLLGIVICKRTNAKIDGSFIATILETASVVSLFFGWKSITEESWDDYNVNNY